MEFQTGRRTIYVPKDDSFGIYRLLDMRGDENLTRTLETAVQRYLSVIEHSLPGFTDAEWCCVFDGLLGVWISDDSSVFAIGEEVAEAIDMDRLDSKWGVDGKEMKSRLAELSYAEKQALVEMTEIFRGSQKEGLSAYSEAIFNVKQKFGATSSPTTRAPSRMSPDLL
jgi:hypothetical protein